MINCIYLFLILISMMIVFVVGLDYVGHEDVLPYKTTEKQPIHNHLFDKFLALDSSSGKCNSMTS